MSRGIHSGSMGHHHDFGGSFQFRCPSPSCSAYCEPNQSLDLPTVALGKCHQAKRNFRTRKRHQKFNYRSVGMQERVTVLVGALATTGQDETHRQRELTCVHCHSATPQLSGKRLLGAEARVGGEHELIFACEMPSTMSNAEASSSTEHFGPETMTACRTGRARAVDDVAFGAAPQSPTGVMTPPIQTEARTLLIEMAVAEPADHLDRRDESRACHTDRLRPQLPPQMVNERVGVEVVDAGEPTKEARRRLTRQGLHLAGKSAHGYLEASSTRWWSTCARITLTLGSIFLAGSVSMQPPCTGTAIVPIQSSRP